MRMKQAHYVLSWDRQYDYTYSGGASGKIGNGGKLTLKHNETATITGLPIGLEYTVTEDDYSSDSYFTSVGDDPTASSTASGDIKADDNQNKVHFRNRLYDTNLIIEKRLEGARAKADPNQFFDFAVLFPGLSDKSIFTVTYSDGRPDGKVKTGDTIQVKGDGQATIYNLPTDQPYKVTEANYVDSGYFTFVDSGTTVGYESTGAIFPAARATFVNRMYDTELVITKTVSGQQAEPDKPFSFTVKFEGFGADRVYDYIRNNTAPGGTIGNNGTFSLKHGETMKIVGLPVGLKYTVTEDDYTADWYEPVQPAEGEIVAGADEYSAPFNNNKHLPGTLVIQKNVMGSRASTTKEFDFTLTFSGAGSDRSYSYIRYDADKGEVDGHLDHGVLTSGYSFKLAHGQRLVVKELPEGLNYEVTEADYSAEKYFIASSENAVGATGATPTFVTFVNAMSPNNHNHPDGPGGGSSGSLTVKKTVTGEDARRDQPFTFVVTFDASGEYAYHGSKRGTVSSGDSITLAHGESITITRLPKGATYRVTEQEANKDGYYSTSTGASGTVTASGQTAAFINAKGVPFVPPNTGDSTPNTLAILALLASSVLLAVLVKLELSLRKKSSKS